MSADLSPIDERLLRRAVAKGGTDYMNFGEESAVLRMEENGLVTWSQASPFVATFYVTDAGREAIA